jgi:hypothetical protein
VTAWIAVVGVQLLLQALAQDIGNVPTRPIHQLLE